MTDAGVIVSVTDTTAGVAVVVCKNEFFHSNVKIVKMAYGSNSRSDNWYRDIAAAERICHLAHDLESVDDNIDDLALADGCAFVEGCRGVRMGHVAGIE